MVGVRTSPWSQQATPTPTGSCCIVTSTRRRVRVWTRQGVLCSHGGMETNQKSLPLNREGKGGCLTLVGVHIFALIGFFAFPGPGIYPEPWPVAPDEMTFAAIVPRDRAERTRQLIDTVTPSRAFW